MPPFLLSSYHLSLAVQQYPATLRRSWATTFTHLRALPEYCGPRHKWVALLLLPSKTADDPMVSLKDVILLYLESRCKKPIPFGVGTRNGILRSWKKRTGRNKRISCTVIRSTWSVVNIFPFFVPNLCRVRRQRTRTRFSVPLQQLLPIARTSSAGRFMWRRVHWPLASQYWNFLA